MPTKNREQPTRNLRTKTNQDEATNIINPKDDQRLKDTRKQNRNQTQQNQDMKKPKINKP